MKDIKGSSNLSSSTKPDYPTSTNSNTFGIYDGFEFTVTFTVEQGDVNPSDSIGLIQVITQSDRTLESAQTKQRSYFPNGFPVLDGDVQDKGILWYRAASSMPLATAGPKELKLPDDPTTVPAEDPATGTSFRGPPTSLKIGESFIIILAKLSGGKYQKLDAWSWSYSDENEKEKDKKVWKTGKFKHSFERVSVSSADITGMEGGDRANNKNKTTVTEVTASSAASK